MRTTVKTCFKCGAEKPLTEFYVHPAMGDGRLNKCKVCTRADVRRNYANNIAHYQAYERNRAMAPHRVATRAAYADTPSGKMALARARAKYIAENPDKRASHIAVGNAVRSGKLIKQPCEICGTDKVHAHHDDYSKPLQVRWLCPSHHFVHHKEHGP
jgi:hypothetical protein